eukprot:499516_1
MVVSQLCMGNIVPCSSHYRSHTSACEIQQCYNQNSSHKQLSLISNPSGKAIVIITHISYKSFGINNFFNHYHHPIELTAKDTEYIDKWILKHKRFVINKWPIKARDKRKLHKNIRKDKQLVEHYIEQNTARVLIEFGDVISDTFTDYWHPKYIDHIKSNFIQIWVNEYAFDQTWRSELQKQLRLSVSLMDTVLSRDYVVKTMLNCIEKQNIVYRILNHIHTNREVFDETALIRLQKEFNVNISSMDNGFKWVVLNSSNVQRIRNGFQCDLCKEINQSKNDLKIHSRIPHIHKCSKCSLRFISFFAKIRHYWVNHCGVKYSL